MKKSIVIALIFALILLVIMVFIFNRSTLLKQAQTPIYKGNIDKIVIGNIGEYSIFNIIAEQNGYFKKNGLDAQVHEYASGPQAVADLLKGKVDIALGADYVGVIRLFDNNNLRILAEASQHTAFQVLARKDRGILTPDDLKGKRVGVTLGGAGQYYLGTFLILHNLSFKDITVVNLPPDAITTQLERGSLDAAVIFDPHAYNIKQTMGDAIIEWSAQGDRKIYDLIYTTDSVVKENPDMLTRYLRALYEAQQYVDKNPGAAQKIIASKLHYSDEYMHYMWGNFTFVLSLDQDLLPAMEDQARFIISNGLSTKQQVPDYLNYIYFDALQTVNPEGVTIIH